MPKKSERWNQEFTRHRSLEDQEPPHAPLPTEPKTRNVVDLRFAVRQLAMSYFFGSAREAGECVMRSSGAGEAMEALDDILAYSVPTSIHVILFDGNHAHAFYVDKNGYSKGLGGYLRYMTEPQLERCKIYQIFVVDDGQGIVELVERKDEQ